MTVTAAMFLAHPASFKGYSAFPTDHIQAVLDYVVRNWTPNDPWGDRQVDGACYLAAHLMSSQVDEMTALASQGAQDSEGKAYTPRTPLSPTGEQHLMSTNPGREYLNLRSLVVGLTASCYECEYPPKHNG